MGFKNIFVITKIVQYNLSNVLLDFALKGRTYLKGLVWKQDTATAKENTQGSAKKKKKKINEAASMFSNWFKKYGTESDKYV